MNEDNILNEVETVQYKNFISRMATDLIRMNFSDMVEVVRCKDCDLRYQYPQNVFCNRHIGKVHDDGFCFEGKQREEKK